MRRVAATTVALIVLALGVPHPARATPTSVEEQLLVLVNGGRLVTKLKMHAGLRVLARTHSQDMDRAGGLNHDGAAGRFDNAAPDPQETNGAPDDGFTGVWCECVAWVGGGPEKDVARLIYNGWLNSPPHYRCMINPLVSAVGLGVYTHNGKWWATLDATQDLTGPGSTQARPVPASKPKVVVTRKPAPVVSTPKATPATTPRREVAVAAATATAPPAAERPVVASLDEPIAVPPITARQEPRPGWLLGTAAGALACLIAAWIAQRARRHSVVNQLEAGQSTREGGSRSRSSTRR